MSAASTGTAAALGTELYRGAQAYYDEINDRGGIHGRPISVAVFDDRYEPLPCVMNTLRLLEEEGVFLLSGYVGTPTLTRALPSTELLHHSRRNSYGSPRTPGARKR